MNKIRELRKEKGLTQMQFCQKFNITQSTISGWESGRWQPDNQTLIKLADYFGVTVDYLLGHGTDSNRIRELRIARNLTQLDLAKALSTTDSNISGWELGKWQPDNDMLLKLADFFDVSIDYLLGRDDWTDEEKAQGIGRYATYLTSDDWDWQELKSEIIEVHGEAYYKTLFATLKALNKLQ